MKYENSCSVVFLRGHVVEAEAIVQRETFPDSPVILEIEFSVPVVDVIHEVAAVFVVSVVVAEQGVRITVSRIERIVDIFGEAVAARVGRATRLQLTVALKIYAGFNRVVILDPGQVVGKLVDAVGIDIVDVGFTEARRVDRRAAKAKARQIRAIAVGAVRRALEQTAAGTRSEGMQWEEAGEWYPACGVPVVPLPSERATCAGTSS